MSAGILGRSYVRACAVRRLLVRCAVVVLPGVAFRAYWGGGFMSTRHSRAPVCSRVPCMIGVPSLLLTMSLCLSRYAVQSASHSFPRLRRLLVKPGMMWPVRAAAVGMSGNASCPVVVDVRCSPVAVRIVVRGASQLMHRSGAPIMK